MSDLKSQNIFNQTEESDLYASISNDIESSDCKSRYVFKAKRVKKVNNKVTA